MKRLTKEDVTFDVTPEPEYESPDGFFASGDDDSDRAMVQRIIDTSEAGDEWAWFCAHVTATWTAPSGREYVGHAYLGGCSLYQGREDFCAPDGYWPDLCDEAFDDLVRRLNKLREDVA